MAVMAIGLYLFHDLRVNTDTPVLWLWMLVAGLGVGPSMAIFTLIVQNDVPFAMLGTATSDLTLFRQIGTSVGLTIAFTIFRNNLTWGLIHDSVVTAGAPAAAVPLTAPAGFDPGALTAVGGSGTSALSQVPAPLLGFYTDGFHQAFSIAIANSVWVGVAAAALAFLTTLVLHEKPLRAHFHAEQAARAGVRTAANGQAAESAK